MDEKTYNKLKDEWIDFLHGNLFPYSEEISEDDVEELYDDTVYQFKKQHDYKEKTIEHAFYEECYDTFKDEFYCRLEELSVTINHEEVGASDKYGNKST